MKHLVSLLKTNSQDVGRKNWKREDKYWTEFEGRPDHLCPRAEHLALVLVDIEAVFVVLGCDARFRWECWETLGTWSRLEKRGPNYPPQTPQSLIGVTPSGGGLHPLFRGWVTPPEQAEESSSKLELSPRRGGFLSQYSTVTALVLRYSDRASSPVTNRSEDHFELIILIQNFNNPLVSGHWHKRTPDHSWQFTTT